MCSDPTCDFVLTTDKSDIWGNNLNIAPGGKICIEGGEREHIYITEVKGSKTQPITITNCNGQAFINTTHYYGVTVKGSEYVHLTGTGNPDSHEYGLKIRTDTGSCLTIDDGSTDIEVDHIEVFDCGEFGSGIVAKTDMKCDPTEHDPHTRGRFVMYDIWIHHNYIHDLPGEGMYIGNSFYTGRDCSDSHIKVYPHDLVGLKIWDNKVMNTGFDGVQVGCAVSGCQVWGNWIENAGLRGNTAHGNGIQIGGGAAGDWFSNVVINSLSNGIIWMGVGDTNIFNNILIVTQTYDGIFADNRNNPPEEDPFVTGTIQGSSLRIIGNTIVKAKRNGIRILSERTVNTVMNNLVVEQESPQLAEFQSGATATVEGNLDGVLKADLFVEPEIASGEYEMKVDAPSIDQGVDLSQYGLEEYNFDYYFKSRPFISSGDGSGWDIGAVEYGSQTAKGEPVYPPSRSTRGYIFPYKRAHNPGVTVACGSGYYQDENICIFGDPPGTPEAVTVPIGDCSGCVYIIKAGHWSAKNDLIGLPPGSRVCIEAGDRNYLYLENFHGNSTHPIIITNCAGRVNIESTHTYGVTLKNSSYVIMDGSGSPAFVYGIHVTSNVVPGSSCVGVDKGSSDIEIHHLEVTNCHFAGIMIKTDPECTLQVEDPYSRDNYVMYDIWVHHNYIHDVGGEGMYIGNSFYTGRPCAELGGVVYPHDIVGLKIWENKVVNTGYDGIQVGCAVSGCQVWGNYVQNAGLNCTEHHGNGMQIGGGASGDWFNNIIINSYSNGIIWMGVGDTNIYNNVIIGVQLYDGIFADNRNNAVEIDPYETGTLRGSKLNIFSNTIVDPTRNGFRILSEVTTNEAFNNLIINHGHRDPYTLQSNAVLNREQNNLSNATKAQVFEEFTDDVQTVKHGSPSIDAGADLSNLGLGQYNYDENFKLRNAGNSWDVGAQEYGASIDSGRPGYPPVRTPKNYIFPYSRLKNTLSNFYIYIRVIYLVEEEKEEEKEEDSIAHARIGLSLLLLAINYLVLIQ